MSTPLAFIDTPSPRFKPDRPDLGATSPIGVFQGRIKHGESRVFIRYQKTRLLVWNSPFGKWFGGLDISSPNGRSEFRRDSFNISYIKRLFLRSWFLLPAIYLDLDSQATKRPILLNSYLELGSMEIYSVGSSSDFGGGFSETSRLAVIEIWSFLVFWSFVLNRLPAFLRLISGSKRKPRTVTHAQRRYL